MTLMALVAEDNHDYQAIMRTTLEFAGYEVESALNGEEAVRMLKEKKYHALFLDLNMPVMSGNALLRMVRSLPNAKEMHIVVVTANSHYVNTVEIEEADFVMMKPFRIDELSQFASHLKRSIRL